MAIRAPRVRSPQLSVVRNRHAHSMNQSPTTQTQAAPANPIAEPNVFLPRGRIGVCSMLFRWMVCLCLLAGTGLLLQPTPESSSDLLFACVLYPVWVFMIITGIKRAHDMGYSAWGVILLSLLPILFLLPGAKQSNAHGPIPARWL